MKTQVTNGLLWVALLLGTVTLTQAQPGANANADKKAEQLMKSKKYGEAIPYINEMIKLEPKNYRWYFEKGVCEEKTKKSTEAKASFNKALEINPKSAESYMHIAMIEIKAKNYDEGAAQLQKAIGVETVPGKKMQYKMMIVDAMVQKGDLGKAKSTLAEVQKVAPDNFKVLYYSGEIKMKEKNWNGAKEDYIKITSSEKFKKMKRGQQAQYNYSLGLCCLEAGDELGAKAAWRKANVGKYGEMIGKKRPEWLVEFSEAALGGEDPMAETPVDNKEYTIDEFGNKVEVSKTDNNTFNPDKYKPLPDLPENNSSSDDMDWGF